MATEQIKGICSSGITNWKNPDIKMLSADGVAPAAENIKNGSYSVVTPIYAVTYEENTNENVEKLLKAKT